MITTTRLLVGATLMVVCGFPLSAGAQRQVRIPASGTTVVTRDFPEGKVVVKIRTNTLDESCSKACPTTRAWAVGWAGQRKQTVVESISIDVNSHSVYVPYGVYAALDGPGLASLSRGKQRFVLRIDANGDGDSSAHFVLIYFDAKAVGELRDYDLLYPSHPLQVTRYYPLVVGP